VELHRLHSCSLRVGSRHIISDHSFLLYSLIELALAGSGNSKELRSLRTVRVIRPLKSLNTFEGNSKFLNSCCIN
jgi:hypothetical protein